MKKEIEIEKWFRAKGTDTYFKTAAEAAEYVSKKLKKEILINLKSEIRMMEQAVTNIEKLEFMICEAKRKFVDLREAWEAFDEIPFGKLRSNKAHITLLLPFKFNWNSKKDLRFLREYVKFCCKSEIKKTCREIRFRKERIKCWQRKYCELEG